MSQSDQLQGMKLAERLTILHQHGTGLLVRVNHLLQKTKKESNSQISKDILNPASPLANVIKALTKNKLKESDLEAAFSSNYSGTVSKDLMTIREHCKPIAKILEPAYSTFIEVMEFRTHFQDLVMELDKHIIDLKIGLNFDTTYLYLELVTTYTRILLLLRRINERKIIATLYHYSAKFIEIELQHSNKNSNQNSSQFSHYKSIQEILNQYENPIKQLIVDFNTHGHRQLDSALLSLNNSELFKLKCQESVEHWQLNDKLTLVKSSVQPQGQDSINNAELIDYDKPWHLVSERKIIKWIYFGYLIRLSASPQHEMIEVMFKHVMRTNLVLPIFRNEVLFIHKQLISIFTNMKNQFGNITKRVEEINENKEFALFKSNEIHIKRRAYIRDTLREQVLLTKEVKGLLAPKLGVLLESLSIARDEVYWTCYHRDNAAALVKGVKHTSKIRLDMLFKDEKLGELIWYMEELKHDISKYQEIIVKYYSEFLVDFDSPQLESICNQIQLRPFELENYILKSIVSQTAEINNTQQLQQVNVLTGIRLDWQRLQLWMMRGNYLLKLPQHQELTKTLNRISFHSRAICDIEKLLIEVADLSSLCFFETFFKESFHATKEKPVQMSYSMAWPLVYAQLSNAYNDMCPEEYDELRSLGSNCVDACLKQISQRAHANVRDICMFQRELNHMCSGVAAAKHVSVNNNERGKRRKKGEANDKDGFVEPKIPLPGSESIRKNRVRGVNDLDCAHAQLVTLCAAITSRDQIKAFDLLFRPQEYFVQQLAIWLNEEIVGLIKSDDAPTGELPTVRRPSEVLFIMKQLMSSVAQISNYIDINLLNIFNTVQLQQTQLEDKEGNKTLTYYYTQWYSNTLLRHAIPGKSQCIVYSEVKRCFVTLGRTEDLFGKNILEDEALAISSQIDAEMYTNRREMRALGELIGAYGLRLFFEQLSAQAVRQIGEIKTMVHSNAETLEKLRKSFKDTERMAALTKKLINVDDYLSRFTLIGVIYQFRELLIEGFNDTLKARIPFVIDSITDFIDHVDKTEPQTDILKLLPILELAMCSGISQQQIRTNCSTHTSGLDELYGLDPLLVRSLAQQRQREQQQAQQTGQQVQQLADDYRISELVLVFIAIALPDLARVDNQKNGVSIFHPNYLANINNGHCISQAVNHVLPALFYVYDNGTNTSTGFDMLDRIRNHFAEFLALTSLSLLELGQSDDRLQTRNRESVYLILEKIVNGSPYLGGGEFELCFPYVLLRNAFQSVRKITATPNR